MDGSDVTAPVDDKSTMLAGLVSLPRHITQPFSLSAVALVCGVLLGIFGPLVASLASIGIAVILLGIGLWRVPRSTLGHLVGGDSYRSVSGLSSARAMNSAHADLGRDDALTQIEALCFLHLYVLEGGSVGRTRIFPINHFVDLMTASLMPDHLAVMVRELSEHMRRCGTPQAITTIASPKRGNSLLLAAVARELGLQPMFVKERPLFGKMVEGLGGEPRRAAIVDDISSDGELLVHCVKVMRDQGYDVDQAFVLIDRTEGDSIEVLGKVGVTLRPMMRLGDEELKRIVDRGRRTRSL